MNNKGLLRKRRNRKRMKKARKGSIEKMKRKKQKEKRKEMKMKKLAKVKRKDKKLIVKVRFLCTKKARLSNLFLPNNMKRKKTQIFYADVFIEDLDE